MWQLWLQLWGLWLQLLQACVLLCACLFLLQLWRLQALLLPVQLLQALLLSVQLLQALLFIRLRVFLLSGQLLKLAAMSTFVAKAKSKILNLTPPL